MKIAVLANLRSAAPFNEIYPSGDMYWSDLDEPETIQSIVNALKELGHHADYFEADLSIIKKLRTYNPDFVFNYAEMHFGASREAQIPAILDMMRLPYTGSGVIGMAVTQHKVMTKKILTCAGISTPSYFYLTNPQEDTPHNLRFPLIVKPAHQGSSVGINMFSRVENKKELKRQIQWLWNKFQEPILIEEFIEGRDMNLGFLADQPLAFVENIIPIGYNSYEFKGEKLSQVQKLCPVEITASVADEIISAGRTAVDALDVYDWCRMDFRIDNENQYYLIEVNAISTLSEKGVFARGAYETGYQSYKEIIEKILFSATARYGMHL